MASLHCSRHSEAVVLGVLRLFFFKQKSAYELRFSDWSSDVCSSDLAPARPSTMRRLCSSRERRRPAARVPGPIARGRRAICAARVPKPHRVSNSATRSEEHTSELQSLMRISYAVFCLKKKNSVKKKSYRLLQHREDLNT